MRVPTTVLPHARLLVLAGFAAACAALFGYLWVNSGGRIPLVSQVGYRVSLEVPAVSNLVYDSDVMVAGVNVGKIVDIEAVGDMASVEVEMHDNFPLHEGVSAEIRNKTLIQESYLDFTDGTGGEIPDGTKLPPGTGKPGVELDDVYRSLDQPTRDSIGQIVRSSGLATNDSAAALTDAVAGLGKVGREGGTVTDALAAQSEDLKTLTGQTATLLAALDTRDGQIAQLVSDSQAVFSATAENDKKLTETMQTLPPLLDSVRGASDDLTTLSGALAPVARDLDTAAPDLSAALTQLPGTSTDLRGMLPSLQGVVDRAPDTLTRVPAVADDASSLVGTLNVAMSDVNPMLAYLQPYDRDVAAFFTNFGQALNRGDINGKTLRIFMVYNEQTVKGVPVDFNQSPLLAKSNAYPAAGGSANPGPFTGQYPRIQQDPPR
ncbi:MlaD family protein [Pseudonocardia sp. ICBG1034]|uniref:MlaD family protein n=1 Tax=Pseudonocardia sp. ICBG1034 TaxID=2844381 RepID=UPI001CCE5785|nr:MlaD family protein [Pseudonocardia sp. ICBG1034]